MLVAVYAGIDRQSATLKGNLHFGRSPVSGDHVEVHGELLIVTKAWHTPNMHFAGPKFAILVQEEQLLSKKPSRSSSTALLDQLRTPAGHVAPSASLVADTN
jgi:hypothetical protein